MKPNCQNLLSAAAILLILFAGATAVKPQASGGKTSGAAPGTKPTTNTTPKPKPAAKPVKPTAPRSSEVANVAGKWWTTGNGFGDSQVVFTQEGPRVSGTITFADGRTGSISGMVVNKRLQHSWESSDGNGGTGWLELSWNNFLGGPWRNQKVRDGSWTLSRIEGNWCFGGSRSRIRKVTHDAQGRLSMVTEDGSQEEGRLEGPWLFLDSEVGSIKGEMNFRANRVDWSTGFYWTWCGRSL